MAIALKCTRVAKTYTSHTEVVRAVSDLTLSITEGTVFGFLGPNGAGKTTTMKMLVGLIAPTSGSITVFGEPVGSLAAARNIGFLPENPHLHAYLSGLEFVTMHGELMGLPYQTALGEAKHLLELVGLRDAGTRLIRTYSKGMAQRAGLAQALIGNPKLLLLDEPFSGLDVLGRFEMKQLLFNLKKGGKTIFFNSHILSEIGEICDSIGIIDQGKLLKSGTIASLLKKNQNLEQYFVDQIKQQRQAG